MGGNDRLISGLSTASDTFLLSSGDVAFSEGPTSNFERDRFLFDGGAS